MGWLGRTKQQRWEEKVDRSGDCWLWTGAQYGNGYGRFYVDRDRPGVGAHRFGYELFVGPIPPDFDIDHLCRNRGCVNPAHLEPVTHAENIKRGGGPAGERARQTECANGHPFTLENTYRYGGKRRCRECHMAWKRRHYHATKHFVDWNPKRTRERQQRAARTL